MTKLDVALFDSLTATSATSVSMSWPELAGLLSDHRERAAKDGDGWSPARYAPGSTRSNGNVDALSALVLDIDHVEPEWWRLAGLRFQAHTSWKHHASHPDCPDRPDCPHWRIVIPLTKPVPRERWGEFWTQATAVLCPNVDPASKDPARFFWLPAHPPGTPCETRSGDGVPLNPARILPPEAAQPDLDRPGDRFNRETDWASILEPHGWVQVPFSGDGERWRRPGKDDGVSATADGGGHRLLYVFTSNAPPLQPQTSYTRLGAFAELEHGGDYSAAAREIADRERRTDPPRGLDPTTLSGKVDGSSPLGGSEDPAEDPRVRFTAGPFSAMRMRLRDMRPHRWAHEGWFRVGVLNTVCGTGGAGKGVFIANETAGWSRGTLPGHFFGQPVRVLLVGDEDEAESDLIPRVVAAGGDVDLVDYLRYDQGRALDLVNDIDHLDRIVRAGKYGVVHFDQVLDHVSSERNSHGQHDVRGALAPLRALAGRHDLAASYTTHPNKLAAGQSLRDRSGGSGQLTDLPRSAMFVGYHPEWGDGWRVVARGKANSGATPAALYFRIEEVLVTNPSSGQLIHTPRIVDLAPDETGMTSEEVLPHPRSSREKPETARQKMKRVAADLGADRGWRLRSDLQAACDMSASTFANEFNALDTIETNPRKGQETRWRIK